MPHAAAGRREHVQVATDLALVRRLVAADHGLAVTSTARPDGSVHSSVVNAGVLDHPVTGGPVVGFVARGAAVKVRLLRRSGRATVTFRAGWEWVAVEGPVELAGPAAPIAGLAPDRVPQLLRDVFSAAGGTHDDWEEYDRVMAAEERLAVLVRPARISSNG
jgi:PPOX class probable F420-dependent enzyme